jgi:hypothetical protein
MYYSVKQQVMKYTIIFAQQRNVDNPPSHECHKATMLPNVTQKSRLADECLVLSVLIHICTIISV